MLQEIYNAIRNDALRQKDVVSFDPHVWLSYRDTNGNVLFREPNVDPRDHVARDIPTIGRFAALNSNGAVWYDHEGIEFLVDDANRRDTVTLAFSKSEPFAKLADLGSKRAAMTQKDLVRMLAFTFRGCVSADFVRSVRSVKWSSSSEGQSTVDRGKASLGKQISSKIEGIVDLPDEVVVTVPVYKDGAFLFTHAVSCFFEADPDTQTFVLYPYPGQIEAAIDAAEEALFDLLTGSVLPKDYKVFKGCVRS